MQVQIQEAIRAAYRSNSMTPVVELVTNLKTLARELEQCHVAIVEHRGAILAASEDGVQIVERLETRWSL